MLIKELALTNFLSYGKTQNIKLDNLNIIIGANGVGKSNLLEAIELLHNAPEEMTKSIREGGGISDWLWKGAKEQNPEAKLDLVFDYSNIGRQDLRHVLSFTSVNQRFEIIDELIEDSKKTDSRSPRPFFYYSFDKGHKPVLSVFTSPKESKRRNLHVEDIDVEKSILAQRKDPSQYPEITWLGNSLSKICIYRDWNFGRYTKPRLPQKVDLPNAFLSNDCDNLGLILNNISLDYNAKKRMKEALSDLNPNIQDFCTKIEGGTVQLYIIENGMTIPATRLSDGTLRFMCLLAILCNPKLPPLICIEEPELGLHPDIISTVAQLLREASEKTQLIITTHSSILVDCFTNDPQYVLVADKNEEGSFLKRLSKEELSPWLEEYRLGKLWLQGEIGGTRW